MFLLYNLALTILSPFWLPWMWLRAAQRKERPNWAERWGNYPMGPKADRRRVWIHAVSVGEVVAALPILREVRRLLPDHEILLSVTTSSGHRTAREQAESLYDHLVYFPIDIARCQLAAMQRAQPAVVAVMETELWMNFLWAAKVFDARTLLINGRISDRSFPRSMRLKAFYRELLGQLDRCLAQSVKDADRLLALGAGSAEVFGNCKFDQALEGLDADSEEIRGRLRLMPDLPVLVVGSTRGEEEEKLVLDAIQQFGDQRLQVIHAPRHLERVPDLAAEVRRRFGGVALRSKNEQGRYLVLDTYGELSSTYSVGDVVVIGGGFANLGGQNLLQALAHGKPVIHGPHMQNFKEVAEAAVEAGASLICHDANDLKRTIERLLESPSERERMGRDAKALIERNAGASARYAAAIVEEALRFHADSESPATQS